MSDPYFCEINLLSSLDWQRSGADIVKTFVQNQQDWMQTNYADFWNDWQKDVFTLGTANDFGLAVWSIILDEDIYGFLSRSPDNYPNWGFGPDDENFYNGSFATEDEFSYEFSTNQKRTLLQLKAFKVLAISGPIIQTNIAMKNIFGENVIIALDNLDMSYSYLLTDPSFYDFIDEIQSRDLLPRPLGIEIADIRFIEADTWGFAVLDENFYDGNFYDGTI